MRVMILGLALLSACGCSPRPEIKLCEDVAKEKLRSPSTYKNVETDSSPMKSLNQWWVIIDYDADNAFGTPIRAKAICKYRMIDGAADTAQPMIEELL